MSWEPMARLKGPKGYGYGNARVQGDNLVLDVLDGDVVTGPVTVGNVRGLRGFTGATPAMSWDVETGAPGSNAEVERTGGTDEAPEMRLTVPRGNTGLTPEITMTTVTLEPGEEVTIDRSGTSEDPVFELGVPRGDKGDKGDDAYMGAITGSHGIDDLVSGDYYIASSLTDSVLGFPEGTTGGSVSVYRQGDNAVIVLQTANEPSETWVRRRSAMGWWPPERNDGYVLESRVSDTEARVAPINAGSEETFTISDRHRRAAFAITEKGTTRFADVEVEADQPGFRIRDSEGRVAFEVDGEGRTHIYDRGDESSGDVTTLHVFVAAGQSNMSGRGRPIEGPVSPRVLQFGANNRVVEQAGLQLDMVDSPSGTSPATFFAHHYLVTQPRHVGVLLVPAARGATVFAGTPESPASGWTWTKGAAADPEYALYERSVEQTLDAIDAAKAEGYHVILKGVLWHQGEGNGGMPTGDYAARLDALIEDYRTDLDHDTLPVVIGQQCPEGMEATPAKYTVDTAHRETPARTPYTGFARASWEAHNTGDTTHFSTVGTAHLGDTFAAGYVQALGNVHAQLEEV